MDFNPKIVFKSLEALIFPSICLACEEPLAEQENTICINCLSKIECTDFHLKNENEIKDKFIGMPFVKGASALYFFDKEGLLQKIMHEFKYNNKPHIGNIIGKYYGELLKNSDYLNGMDCIIPIPLHKSKRRKRGYNQSEYLAEGISHTTKIPLVNDALIKIRKTESQTRKSLLERWLNVKEIFTVRNAEKIYSKNILVVDDVVTTGSTLASAIEELHKSGAASIKVCTIAWVRN